MDRDRWVWAYRLVCGGLVVLAVVVAARTSSRWEVGQSDPVSAVLALGALALAVWAGRQASLAQRTADTDVQVQAVRLAEAVAEVEGRQRAQLLTGQDRTIDVAFVFTRAPGHNVTGAHPVGTLADVVTYFRRLQPQRLVITGAPGAGKTVLAVELILGLLAHPQPGDPVPVRLSAATWNPDIPVTDWLTAQLVAGFSMTPVTARKLVASGRILPVIDGLDEMDPDPGPGRSLGYDSAASRALRALNLHQQGRDKPRLVVTCRTDQYDDLVQQQVWARDAARIALQPVGPGPAERFIRAVSGDHDLSRWQPVLTALNQPGHVLAGALSTPWRLTLASTVYSQRHATTGEYLRDPADLATLTHPDTVRDHLLSLYLPAITAAATPAGDRVRYRDDQIHRWLAVLARHLHDNTTRPPVYGRALSSTDLVLHELWPLAGRLPHHLTSALCALLYSGPLAFVFFKTGLGWASALAAFPWPAVFTWLNRWPQLFRLDLAQIKTPAGRRKLAGWLVGLVVLLPVLSLLLVFVLVPGLVLVLALTLGLKLGRRAERRRNSGLDPHESGRSDLLRWFVFGFAFGFMFGFAPGPMFRFGSPLGWVTLGLMFGVPLGLGLGFGFVRGSKSRVFSSGTDPREPVRGDLLGWFAFGFPFGFVTGLGLGLAFGLEFGLEFAFGFTLGFTLGFAFGFTFGLGFCLAFGLGGGQAGTRYMMLLVCRGRRLPWRLGHFLDWCYRAGPIRVSGVAYQFRHRELQDYLAAHPFPLP